MALTNLPFLLMWHATAVYTLAHSQQGDAKCLFSASDSWALQILSPLGGLYLSVSSSTSSTSPVAELLPSSSPLPAPLGRWPRGHRERHTAGSHGSGAPSSPGARSGAGHGGKTREHARNWSPLGPGPAPRPGGHLPALLAGRTRRAPWSSDQRCSWCCYS